MRRVLLPPELEFLAVMAVRQEELARRKRREAWEVTESGHGRLVEKKNVAVFVVIVGSFI